MSWYLRKKIKLIKPKMLATLFELLQKISVYQLKLFQISSKGEEFLLHYKTQMPTWIGSKFMKGLDPFHFFSIFPSSPQGWRTGMSIVKEDFKRWNQCGHINPSWVQEDLNKTPLIFTTYSMDFAHKLVSNHVFSVVSSLRAFF